MRLVGIDAEAALVMYLVLDVLAVKLLNVRNALECENVSGGAVQ
jgi:hypothetical protein